MSLFNNTCIDIENYLAIINTIIALLLSYIALGENIARFGRWIRNKITHYYDAQEIVKLILKWFEIVDEHDYDSDLSSTEMSSLGKIENEIQFLFHREGIERKMILKSTKHFRNKYLKYVGLKKSARTVEEYIKYAHIKNINFQVSLDLISSSHHKKYTSLKFPLSFYWMIIKGNYYQWKEQYAKNWEGIEDSSKVIYSDIEMPMKVLRMYYKV